MSGQLGVFSDMCIFFLFLVLSSRDFGLPLEPWLAPEWVLTVLVAP